MKKFFILVIFLLIGCTEEKFNVENKLAEAMGSTANFSVTEEFFFQQYGVNEEQPHNRTVEITNLIEYNNSVIYTENDIRLLTDFHGEKERGYYSFSSYKDLLNNKGYVKPENDWYAVELTQMYKLGMGSIDPAAIVNAILFQNEEINYRGENQVSVDPTLYRIAVADLSSDTFESLFASSIFNFIEVDLEYTVIATMKFDDNYQVEYIEFDINELVQQYSDYNELYFKSNITSIRGNYTLTYSGYNEVEIDSVTDYVDWILDENYSIERPTETLPETSIGSVKTDVVYSEETSDYVTTVSMELSDDLKYMYYELYFYSDGELVDSFFSEYYDLLEFDDIVVYFDDTGRSIDEVFFVTRYITTESSDIYSEASEVPIFVQGPIHSVEIDFSDYTDEATELVPSILIDSLGIVEGEPKYEVTLDMYATEETRNGQASLYLYENKILKEIIELKDFNIAKYEGYRFSKVIGFRPDEIYMDLNYKTSYLWFNEKHIKMDIHLIEEPMDFSMYNDELEIKTYEQSDAKWYASKFQITFSLLDDADVLEAYVYFVNEVGMVVGWEYIYDFNVDDVYEVVTDLYEEDIEKIYLEVNVDGVEYKIIGRYGIIVQ